MNARIIRIIPIYSSKAKYICHDFHHDQRSLIALEVAEIIQVFAHDFCTYLNQMPGRPDSLDPGVNCSDIKPLGAIVHLDDSDVKKERPSGRSKMSPKDSPPA
jgi:hypothetical protein